VAIAWEPIEDAIFDWVVAGTGLPEERVQWADQNADQPDNPSVSIRVGDLVPVGAVDEVQHEHRPELPAGADLETRTSGVREFAVSLQAFTDETHGSQSARALLVGAQGGLRRPALRSALHAAGLVPVDDAGPVQNLSALDVADFEGRAVLTVRFAVREEALEYGSWIATVTAEPAGAGNAEGENP
jgi:hypothetical protein